MTPSPRKADVPKFRVRGCHPASFKFVPTKSGPASDFNIIVVKDSNPDHVIKQDIGPEPTASVEFTLQNTEIVRVRVINNNPKSTPSLNRAMLDYNASPNKK